MIFFVSNAITFVYYQNNRNYFLGKIVSYFFIIKDKSIVISFDILYILYNITLTWKLLLTVNLFTRRDTKTMNDWDIFFTFILFILILCLLACFVLCIIKSNMITYRRPTGYEQVWFVLLQNMKYTRAFLKKKSSADMLYLFLKTELQMIELWEVAKNHWLLTKTTCPVIRIRLIIII